MSDKKIEDVIKEHRDKLITIPGVVGVGEGRSHGKPCIVIFVQDEEVNSQGAIPDTIEGYSIIIKESGNFSSRE